MNLILILFSFISCTLLVNIIRNLLLFRRSFETEDYFPTVSILIPARNEEDSISKLINSLQAQDYPQFTVQILDDESTDSTFQVSIKAIENDKRFSVRQSVGTIPSGWLGKSWACQQLATNADGEIFCFIDADVILAPQAISQSVRQMLGLQVDVLCPYPRQITTSFLTRIIQPLLQWSWMSTLPLDYALKSNQPSLSVGNGQLLFITSEMYRNFGGHSAVKSEILEDIELVKAVKRAGGKGGVWDGSEFAQCTMYRTNSELIQGYSKSLWRAFGSISRGLLTVFMLLFFHLYPLFELFSTNKQSQVLALVSVVTVLLGRLLVHIHFRYRILDTIFYPLSFLVLTTLMIVSGWKKRCGSLTWKGRTIHG